MLRGHSRAHELDTSKLPDQHRWEWFAYDYAWHIARGLGDRSQIDPGRHWRSPELVRIATGWYRKQLCLRPVTVAPPLPQDPQTVRPNWRQFHLRDLTEAERALANERIDETMRRLRAENPRAFAMVERAMSPRKPRHMPLADALAEVRAELGIPDAKEIPPP